MSKANAKIVPNNPVGVNIDDNVLVELCRSGDSAAMERLIRKYQNRIYNVILKICRNPDDAAELTQETFVKIIESINGFRSKSSFYTWAFRIAVNLTLNYCQKHSRFTFTSLEADSSDQAEAPIQALRDFISDDGSPDPATVAQNKELCRIAMEMLGRLDESQRAVLVLRDIEGMQYTQIARVLDIELGTVRSRLSRARGNLRDIMEAIVR